MNAAPRFRAVVLGVSTGGVDALKRLLPALPAGFALPILIVIHIAPGSSDGLARLLDGLTQIRVKEADEGELAVPGVAYVAPANYHLLVEPDGRLGLSTDSPVNCARPSVDVLFESAALCYGAGLIGVILTGAGGDGAPGLACVARLGGFTIVQEPGDAQMDSMPSAALAALSADRVVALDALAALLAELAGWAAP
ncbi:MAG: chemotaxis protein CheB [Pseudomonadota bacterium]